MRNPYLLRLFLALAVAVGIVGQATAAQIPPFYLDCVVAIGYRVVEKKEIDGEEKEVEKWVAVATGFLYGDFLEKASETESTYRIYMVTNRHVLEIVEDVEKRRVFDRLSEHGAVEDEDKDKILKAFIRLNPKDSEPAKEFVIELRKPDGARNWFPHPESDVAVVVINPKVLTEAGIEFNYFRSEQHVADRAKASELGVSEGDGVFVLGFPMGLVGGERNFVLVRTGAIARIRDALAGAREEFLVDAFVFPGNSGGPVVTKTEIAAIRGTKPLRVAYLIGVVKSYVPYRDVAVSQQTRRPRVIFEENSGLASVIPIDFVKEVIKEHRKTLPP